MQVNISQYSFRDLVDVPAFARMLASFFRATGIPNGVVDASGELISLAAGDNACTLFHRANPGSEEQCRKSNVAIMRNLREGCVAGGPCLNGLMDYATPVVIEGRQLATLFLGQVLHEPPDMEFFREQARKFGYDEVAYLKAIAGMPVVDKERLQTLMAVMVEMAHMLAESGLARLRQSELEHNISSITERRVQLEDILDSSPIAIGWTDGEGRVEYINRQFTRLFGYEMDDIPNLESWRHLAYPEAHYRETKIDPWSRAVAEAQGSNHIPPELESDVACKDGSTRRVIVRASWVGQRRLVNFTDITDRWHIEQRNHARDAMLEMVARGVMLDKVLNAIVQQVEQEALTSKCSILLLDEEGKHLLSGAAPSLPDFYNQAVHGLAIGAGVGSCGTAAYLGQRVIVEDIQSHEYWKSAAALAQQAGLRSCWSEPIISSQGKVLGTFAIYYGEPKAPQADDIERISFAANLAAIAIESRRNQEELERRAYTDYLTGLVNRRRFFERAENELTRALRYGQMLSLLMFDVDHFKLINDGHGHKTGDQVLKKLSEICRTTLRNIDVVGRIGGEEFAALLPETNSAAALEAAERLREALAAARVPLDSGGELNFTASFGVASLNQQDINIDLLMSQADRALYRSKNEGRNRTTCVQ